MHLFLCIFWHQWHHCIKCVWPLQVEDTVPETHLQKTPAQLAGEAALKRTRTSDSGIDFPGIKRTRAATEEDLEVAEDVQPAETHDTLGETAQEAAPLAQEPISPVPSSGIETATQEVNRLCEVGGHKNTDRNNNCSNFIFLAGCRGPG